MQQLRIMTECALLRLVPEIAGQLQILTELVILAVLYSMCPRELKYREIGNRELGILAALCAACGVLTIAGGAAPGNLPVISGMDGTIAGQYGAGSAGSVFGIPGKLVVILVSMAPGILILVFSFLTDGKIGQGDAWLFLALGLRLEPMNNYLLCQSSLVLAAMIGLFHRRRELPLVPCVALVMSLQMTGQIVEMLCG